jgi:hypothetical protein
MRHIVADPLPGCTRQHGVRSDEGIKQSKKNRRAAKKRKQSWCKGGGESGRQWSSCKNVKVSKKHPAWARARTLATVRA